MSDELISLLRSVYIGQEEIGLSIEAADCIEALERQNADLLLAL